MMQPTTFAEYIEAIRSELICERCRKYVGSLERRRYLPPPYAVAIGKAADDEAETLVAYEWHMVGLIRGGKFVIRHPEREGRCITYREWVASDAEDNDGDEDAG